MQKERIIQMIKSEKDKSLNTFRSLLTNDIFKAENIQDYIELMHDNIYDFYEILYYFRENDKSDLYKSELIRNIFESIYLINNSRLVSSMHMLRSCLELFAKLQNSRINDEVKSKFSENIDVSVKHLKRGNKKNKSIIIESKENSKEIYSQLCEFVHTGEKITIKPFEVMEEVFYRDLEMKDFEEFAHMFFRVIKSMIALEILMYANHYFEYMPSLILSDLKNKYLSDKQKEYFFNVTNI